MAVYLRLDKMSDDGRSVTSSFTNGENTTRTLVFDREQERLWPEDGNEDAMFETAAITVVRAWRKGGDMPARLLFQA